MDTSTDPQGPDPTGSLVTAGADGASPRVVRDYGGEHFIALESVPMTPPSSDGLDGLDFLDLATVEERTGLSRGTIASLVESGELASVKVGARRLVPVPGYRAWRDSL